MNPSQKSGNYRNRRKNVRPRKGDYHIKKIARIEAKKVVSKKVESKVYDRSNSAFNIDYNMSSSVFSMTGSMVPGTLEGQFIGDSIEPTHLRIKWTFETVDFTNICRVIVLQDIAGSGVPTANTLFQSAGNIITPLSAYNTAYNQTYKILYDEFFVGVYGAYGTNSYKISGDIRITSKKLRKVGFLGGAGNSDVTSGALYLCFVSDSSNVTPPIGQYYSRLYYKDA